MRNISFTPTAFSQFNDWRNINKKMQDRIIKLLEEIQRNPFEGTGKPEPLKFNLKGCWSRRIDDEHRLVYQVTNDEIIIISCKFHY
ncbi:toxin YoeB [Runella defluvii]|uniref:Putative mRNA interferase YoeB n=1 Tax=Runella defluvii TaxID=370973 RepID=A0A7W5ZH92_9BACT|nr:Txe/YoeB family addiction module toxin [Runella defluvii]MBB3836560.1 toxin YoeB [Runella defluvii]HAK77500.1 Txe/YoeB family addiction module toxin [Runella sp.]HAO48376.1 Txe/YoeB family addiction module toxin [Runella sp.]